MENNMDYRKVWLFSHNDLDGYACNVVARAFLLWYTNELVEMNCDYSKIENRIRECIPEIDKENDLVIVSDISWDKTSTDITDFMKSLPEDHLIVADHHKSSEWIGKKIERNSVVTIEGDRCGCEILKDILESMLFFVSKGKHIELVKFTSAVSGWDLWTWADEPGARDTTSIGNLLYRKSVQLSAWFEWCLKCASGMKFVETVITRLYDNNRSLYAGMQEEYKNEEFQKYIKTVRDMLYDASRHYYRFIVPVIPKNLETLLFVLPKGFQQKSLLSMIANNNIKKSGYCDYDCIAIWVEGDDNISLRYPTRGIDLSEALKTCCWGGGGHKFAAGTHPGHEYMEEICKWNTLWNL